MAARRVQEAPLLGRTDFVITGTSPTHYINTLYWLPYRCCPLETMYKNAYGKRRKFFGYNLSWAKFLWVSIAHRNYGSYILKSGTEWNKTGQVGTLCNFLVINEKGSI